MTITITGMKLIFSIIAMLWLLVSCASSREPAAAETCSSDAAMAYRELSDSQSVNSSAVSRTVERTFDTLIVDRTRIVREADSTEMADYGIRLQGLQKAYVVFEKEVRDRIRQLETLSSDTLKVESSKERRSLERDSTSHVVRRQETVEKKTRRGWLETACDVCLVINCAILLFILVRKKS